jgi:alpha/beta superfamily hydrolase
VCVLGTAGTHESWRTRFETPEGVNQADGRLNRTRQTQDASAVCKHPNPDAEGSDANSRAS